MSPYSTLKDTFKSIIKGTFLGDKIFISLENNKEKDYFLKTFVVKLFNSNLFTSA